jgi:hypothetical protein
VCILQILKEVTSIGLAHHFVFLKHWVLPNVEAQRGASCTYKLSALGYLVGTFV